MTSPVIAGDALQALSWGRQSVVPRHPADTASTDAQPGLAWAFSSFTTICSGVCFENFLMVIHSARPQAARTTQNNPLKTNGPKNPDPSTGLAAAPRAPTPPPPRHNGGFCTIRSILSACRRRVAPLLLQFPRLLAVRSRSGTVRSRFRAACAPTSQTTAATNADNGVSWARQSASWTQRRLTARVARTRTRYRVR